MVKPRATLAPIFHDRITNPSSQVLTPRRSRRFEQARQRLAALAKREPEHVTDEDTVEFLARGELATQVYLLSAGGSSKLTSS
jgi:hypothetical protein